jgi:hypothetical protein
MLARHPSCSCSGHESPLRATPPARVPRLPNRSHAARCCAHARAAYSCARPRSPGPTPCLQPLERPFSREPHTSAPDAHAHLALVLHASPARPRSPSAELPSTGPIPVMHALPARVLPPSAPRASARPTWARLLPLQLPLRLLLQLVPRAARPAAARTAGSRARPSPAPPAARMAPPAARLRQPAARLGRTLWPHRSLRLHLQRPAQRLALPLARARRCQPPSAGPLPLLGPLAPPSTRAAAACRAPPESGARHSAHLRWRPAWSLCRPLVPRGGGEKGERGKEAERERGSGR